MWARRFVRVGDRLLPVDAVTSVHLDNLGTDGSIKVYVGGASYEAKGTAAVEALETLYPAVLEGSRGVRWLRRSWTRHNLLGHPLMEILSRLGFSHLGLMVHDATVPGVDRVRGVDETT